MNAVFVTTLQLMLITCIFASADREEEDKAIFLRNFGCSKPEEYPPHRPNAPNCPCGKYAIKIKTKHLTKYQERTGYWDVEKRRWQLYRCKKCDICYNVQVRKPCSADLNTECGQCDPPLLQTSIGCLTPPTNMSVNETTTFHLQSPAELKGRSESTPTSPVYLCNNPCATGNNNDHYEWIPVVAVVVFLLCVITTLITALVVLCLRIYQCGLQRRQSAGRRATSL